MKIRPATLADLEALTDLVVANVSNDGFHDYFFPRQNEFPEDFRSWWRRFVRNDILQPYSLPLVAEEEGRIIAWAVWGYMPMAKNLFSDEKKPPEPKDLNIAKNSYYEVAQRRYFAAVDKATDYLHPCRCIDMEHMAEWGSVVGRMVEAYWAGTDKVHWHCFESSARKGEAAGSAALAELVQWGVAQADRDGVVAAGESLGAFESLGFRLLGEWGCGTAWCGVWRRPLKGET